MIKDISPEQVYQLLHSRSEMILLDVRRDDEFEISHIPNALHIPLDKLLDKVETIIPNKESDIIIYCRSGVRSKEACNILSNLEYQHIGNMVGGILAWQYTLDSKKSSS